MRVTVDYKYIEKPGRAITVKLHGMEPIILKSEMPEASGELDRYKIELHATGNANNVHKQYVLDLLPHVDGVYYVMSFGDAEALAATGRKMSDVYFHKYDDEGYARLWNHFEKHHLA